MGMGTMTATARTTVSLSKAMKNHLESLAKSRQMSLGAALDTIVYHQNPETFNTLPVVVMQGNTPLICSPCPKSQTSSDSENSTSIPAEPSAIGDPSADSAPLL